MTGSANTKESLKRRSSDPGPHRDRHVDVVDPDDVGHVLEGDRDNARVRTAFRAHAADDGGASAERHDGEVELTARGDELLYGIV